MNDRTVLVTGGATLVAAEARERGAPAAVAEPIEPQHDQEREI